MELISIDNSRLTALFTLGSKAGQLYLPAAMAALVKRYSFVLFPPVNEAISSNVVEFKHGLFNGSAIDFGIYSDGVVINAKSNSQLLEVFLEDLTSWIIETLNVSVVQNHANNRMYESSIIFSSDSDILRPLAQFKKVQDRLADMVRKTTNLKVQFDTFGIGFAADPNLIPGIKPGSFQIERWAQADFSMNKYLSRAPLRTDDHMELITMIENLL